LIDFYAVAALQDYYDFPAVAMMRGKFDFVVMATLHDYFIIRSTTKIEVGGSYCRRQEYYHTPTLHAVSTSHVRPSPPTTPDTHTVFLFLGGL